MVSRAKGSRPVVRRSPVGAFVVALGVGTPFDVNPEPDLLPGTGIYTGPIHTGFGDLSIPEFLQAATTAEILFEP